MSSHDAFSAVNVLLSRPYLYVVGKPEMLSSRTSYVQYSTHHMQYVKEKE